MAEVVNRNSEEILPQFEEIIRLKLFSTSEISEIIQRHVDYEYKTARREKQATDYQQYINYKSDFLKLVRIRMKTKRVDKKDRKKIERMLVRHISKLYNTMVKYHSTDADLWLKYIEFMIKERDYAKVVVLYDSLLGFHMGDPELFISSAKFMMKYIKDVELARKTLFKGIRIHKRNPQLYLELFKVELDFASRKRRESKEDTGKLNSDPVLCGKTAEVVCFSALKVINDMHFKFSLLEICSKYKFTKSLQKKIYKMLKNEYPYDADMWKKIALLQLDGVNFENIDMTGLKSKNVFKQRVWRCFNMFWKAVKVIPTDTMWFYFIDTFFELLKTNTNKHEFISKFILKLMNQSEVEDLLKEEHYMCWIENSQKCYPLENLIGLVDGAIKLYPRSANLWLKKLQYHLSRHDPEKFKEIFMGAHKSLKDEHAQYKLWQFMLESCVDFSVPEINTFFENMMKESPVTYPTLRPLYLDWIISKNNLALARNVFSNISQMPPYNIELYKTMINTEISQPTVDIKQVRHLYETACLYFGSTHSELWLDYVQFEKLYGSPALVAAIYWTAVKQLEPSLSDKFITEYSLCKAT